MREEEPTRRPIPSERGNSEATEPANGTWAREAGPAVPVLQLTPGHGLSPAIMARKLAGAEHAALAPEPAGPMAGQEPERNGRGAVGRGRAHATEPRANGRRRRRLGGRAWGGRNRVGPRRRGRLRQLSRPLLSGRSCRRRRLGLG